jgi:hypothetical protein
MFRLARGSLKITISSYLSTMFHTDCVVILVNNASDGPQEQC